MKYIVKTDKSIEEAYASLESAIVNNKFGLQHTHNVKEKLEAKGVELGAECIILDICNPVIAKEILDIDLSISANLPCAISVYNKDGQTNICVIKPTAIFPLLNPKLKDIAQKVEQSLIKIIDEAK